MPHSVASDLGLHWLPKSHKKDDGLKLDTLIRRRVLWRLHWLPKSHKKDDDLKLSNMMISLLKS